MKKIIFILICILFSNFLFANIILENNSFDSLALEKYTQIYIDESSDLEFEEIKNKEFKKIVDTNRRRIVKMLEDTCFNEVERAKDENHIQAIVNEYAIVVLE